MKQNSKKIISIALIALVIIVGIVVVCVWGFNKELRYVQGQRIDILVDQKVDIEKVKSIADEVLGMHNTVQVVEIYQEMVTIKAGSISEEQRNSIVSKLKENYEFEQTAEDTDITTVPATRFRDIYKQYVVPFVVSMILVTLYMMARYYKKGALKVLIKILAIPVVSELLLLSWMAIVRLPVGRFTPALVLLVYVVSLWATMKEIEK